MVRLCGNLPALWTVNVYSPALNVLAESVVENSLSVAVIAVLPATAPPCEAGELDADPAATEADDDVVVIALPLDAPAPLPLLEEHPAASSAAEMKTAVADAVR